MAAKKKQKVVVEIEVEVLEKLIAAADALSELANCAVFGCDDPVVRAKLTKLAAKNAKKKTKGPAKRR